MNEYPDSTEGSEIAERLRSETNRLTEQQRSDLLNYGMQIIYGKRYE